MSLVSPDRREAAWRRTDEIFALVREDAWLLQPIRLRQPLLFYVGHLPAFAWNQLGRGVLGREPFEPAFDALFARGIDPEEDHDPGHAWPALARVLAYRDRVRDELRQSWPRLETPVGHDGLGPGPERTWMVLEHELMHHETLLYMLARLPADRVAQPPVRSGTSAAAEVAWLDVAGRRVHLGTAGDVPFAWDNETPDTEVEVPAFRIESSPVTNRAFLGFVADGGYARREWWSPRAWEWRERAGVDRPASWTGAEPTAPRGVVVVGGEVPFAEGASWPAAVSHAEAEAYARWSGRRLPREAELVAARAGAAPDTAHLGFDAWHPRAAGTAPDVSPAGLRDAWGNGWEWTSTPFGPWPGFRPHPAYPGYSADFFDGRHYVLRGGSWATDRQLARAGFRNWFQPHYPWVFSKFRCAEDA